MTSEDRERESAEREFVQSLVGFIKREVRPVEERHSAELRETGTLDPAIQLRERRALRKKSAELGFYGMGLPEEVGGLGVSPLGVAWAMEAVGASGLLLADRGGVLPNVEGPSVAMVGAMNDQQRKKYLEPLVRAEIEGCWAITEPGAGSDVSLIRTSAVRDGEDWLISGTKQFITHGAHADFVQVVAVTDPDLGSRGLTTFIVDAGAEGLTVGPAHRTLGEDRPVDLYFDNVRLSDDAIVGERGGAMAYALRGIGLARIQVGALALGKSRYLLERMIVQAKERHAFGRPIGAFQMVQQHIVDSSLEIEGAAGLVEAAARIAHRDDAESRRLAASCKVVATETLSRVADRAIQVFGGGGVITEMGIERYYRDARAMRIYEGTSEVLRTAIAKWLGLPAS